MSSVGDQTAPCFEVSAPTRSFPTATFAISALATGIGAASGRATLGFVTLWMPRNGMWYVVGSKRSQRKLSRRPLMLGCQKGDNWVYRMAEHRPKHARP